METLAVNYRPKGRAALGRSSYLKPPALPEVADMRWNFGKETCSVHDVLLASWR